MKPILQHALPEGQAELAGARLPAMRSIPVEDWLHVDDAYPEQLAEKARLMALRPRDVVAVLPSAEAAVAELSEMIEAAVLARPEFGAVAGGIRCPDGRVVAEAGKHGFARVAQLVQEDICILQTMNGEAVLTAALLCFPAGWTLAEKIGHPMRRIHSPVPPYDTGVAVRVQRMFDHLPVGRVLLRANLLRYDDPTLYQPHSEAAPRPVGHPGSPYLRSERQTLRRLPRSGAIAFTIHTSVVRRDQQA
ncbi:heme-dependent oxidative N-demethylase family protein [Flavimaricola marinus]|uniref:DUF3445 domain-containing protein n=1 Tax=Flavimaricola marinus TaxID=1819565 RepID=A0A238LHE9_9RHOB|nr:DUF3445 domain-containing protein [Flavimaricola marinus]SMY09058.1 hypothetical protein LOM8899_03220 [Flavimaricola marinus]